VAHAHWTEGQRGNFEKAPEIGVKTLEGWCYEVGALILEVKVDVFVYEACV
jgi:hypothetical protein